MLLILLLPNIHVMILNKKKTSSLEEDIADSREKIEKRTEQKKEKKDLKKQNEVINNMLSYFKERFEGNE